jgi:hypothetical protein
MNVLRLSVSSVKEVVGIYGSYSVLNCRGHCRTESDDRSNGCTDTFQTGQHCEFFKREESESIVKIDEIPRLEDHFADQEASDVGETYR